jgi:hypothetical protein
MAAEWIKFFSLRSMPLSLLGLAVWYGYRGWRGTNVFGHGVEWFPVMAGTGALGALTVVSEHASGLIRTTFTAVPDRLRVAAAKTAVLTAVMAGFGVAVTGEVYGLSSRHVSLALTAPGVAALLVSTVVLMPLCALIGMAFGALIRNTAASMVAVCAFFLMVPLLFKSPTTRWSIDVGNALPCYAWARLGLLGHGKVVGGETFTAALAAFVLWPLVSAAVVAVVLDRRDV